MNKKEQEIICKTHKDLGLTCEKCKNNEVPEIKRKSNAGKWFIGIICLILIVGGAIYFEYHEEINAKLSGVELNKTTENNEFCYNETHIINYQRYVSFNIINQSSYCNLIPVSWTDENNQTYSTELISINCLKGGNS